MPVEFYLHTPMLDNLNEKRAFMRVAHLIHQQYGQSSTPFTLIANIQPEVTSPLKNLPQLDALLLGPEFVAILEFKNYFAPIQANYLDGKWKAIVQNRSQVVAGGSKRNPYLQARHAKKAWQLPLKDIVANHLNAFILFHPYLHPDSKLPPLGQDNYWLRINGVEDILELIYTTSSPHIALTLQTQQTIAKEIFQAQLWPQVSDLLTDIIGYLHVLEPGQTPVRYPIHPFDDFTLGRSARQKHRVRLQSSKISSTHAHIYAQNKTIYIEDLGSKNGTFLAGKTISKPTRLHNNEKVTLGSQYTEAVSIWIQTVAPEFSDFTTMTK